MQLKMVAGVEKLLQGLWDFTDTSRCGMCIQGLRYRELCPPVMNPDSHLSRDDRKGQGTRGER